MATFYINAPTLSEATSVFTDLAQTICASNGYYSDGLITRLLTDCELGPIVDCPDCLAPCGVDPFNINLGQGIFRLDLDTGNTPADTGAIIVKLSPASIPDGVKAVYNGVTYNEVSSSVDGYHGSSVPNGHVYVGNDSAICVPGVGTYYDVPVYNWVGTSFVSSGSVEDVVVQAGELSFSSGVSPGTCVMVIPKPTATPKEISFEFVGVCSSTALGIEVLCPEDLPSFTSSQIPAVSSVLACAEVADETYYHYNFGAAGTPTINDWVFYDPNGEFRLPAGFYKITATDWIEVGSNGVVINEGVC
jgi:hypothetical protein